MRKLIDVVAWPALAALLILTIACGSESVTGPSPETRVSSPESASQVIPTEGLSVTCGSGGVLRAVYQGPASYAAVETWYTGFDDQDPNPRPGLQVVTLPIGGDVQRIFPNCSQGDAAITGGKEYGCFFDKRGEPFKADGSPESNAKTAECRYVPPCQGECEPTPSPSPTPTPSPSPTPTPSPVCANTAATGQAAQGFELANSGDATELAWVTANVVLGPFKLIDKDEAGKDFTDTNGSHPSAYVAKVVLVKAGTTYKYYLNVVVGTVLTSFDGKEISHISYFGCK